MGVTLCQSCSHGLTCVDRGECQLGLIEITTGRAIPAVPADSIVLRPTPMLQPMVVTREMELTVGRENFLRMLRREPGCEDIPDSASMTILIDGEYYSNERLDIGEGERGIYLRWKE